MIFYALQNRKYSYLCIHSGLDFSKLLCKLQNDDPEAAFLYDGGNEAGNVGICRIG
jgi:hypothetical protein